MIKCVGAEHHPDQHGRLLDAAGERPDVQVIDRKLPAAEMAALMEAADCYVSLHRSEGFGLTIAEAMLRGKPVVATNYGGPRDFLTAENSFPVDYRLVPIGPGNDPYPAEGRWADPDLGQAAAWMRFVRDQADEAARRAARGREDVAAAHSPTRPGGRWPAGWGRSPSCRSARPTAWPPPSSCAGSALQPPEPAPESLATPLRRPLRKAVLRLIKPQAVHQRLVDEEIARLLATLEERLEGLAASQASLQGELAELRKRLEDRP